MRGGGKKGMRPALHPLEIAPVHVVRAAPLELVGPGLAGGLHEELDLRPHRAEAAAEELARIFRESGNQFKPVLRMIFSSEAFYAPDVIRNQVKSPVQWLVGSVRLLERDLPPAPVCMGLTRNLGQDLFAHVNLVKGERSYLAELASHLL